MQRFALRKTQRLFFWFGVSLLVYVGGMLGYAQVYQRYQDWKFDNEGAEMENDFKPDEGDIVGRLEIPSVGISVMVLEGSDEKTLAAGAGHLTSSPLPGASGNVAIAAHRDTFFRNLKSIQQGDSIRFSTLRRSFDYVVESVETVDPEDIGVLKSRETSELTLITCYPYLVDSQRMVVFAQWNGQ